MPSSLTPSEKLNLFRDGFVVIKNAVPEAIHHAARDTVTKSLPADERRLLAPPELAGHPTVLALFNDSGLRELMEEAMGPFPPVISSQVAVTPPRDVMGGSPGPHVDGSWGGAIPDDPAEIDTALGRPIDVERYFGPDDTRRGSNDGQLWQDPARRISLGSYTALVGVAINDQLIPGRGQFAVIRGAHEAVEAVFRAQRDSGGVIGPEGADWPRIKISSTNRPFLNGLPDSIRARAQRNAEAAEPIDGWPWPMLTPVCLAAGDAVVALHSCPHTPTPNHGPEPRMNVYFRLRRRREGNPHEGTRRIGHGVSDHPDRGYFGQFLDYPPGHDAFQISIDKLCDHWSEWDGMRDIVRGERHAA